MLMKLSWLMLPVSSLVLLAGCRSSEPAAIRTYEYRMSNAPPPEMTRQRTPPPSGFLQQKMQFMVIPRLEFRQASIEDVVTVLTDWSRQLDPRGEGVNFILVPPSADYQQRSAKQPAPRLTLNLRRVSMYDAVRLISEVSNCHYAVTDKAVKLYFPGDEPTAQVVTRIYPVHPSFMNVIKKVEPSGRFSNPHAISTLR
jgi:hypothetical protein